MGVVDRVSKPRRSDIPVGPTPARSPPAGIFLWSRVGVWVAAAFALLVFEPNRHPRADTWDRPWIHDSGWLVDLWARWDSVWFVRIASDGYASADNAAAFFPLYPAAIAALGRALLGHFVLAGVAISLAATVGSFLLLHRLAEERLGADGARRAVLYLALFPTSLFLQAVYSEALFLFLVLLAFFLAERRRWVGAGLVTGAAILTRFAGVALLPALALLAWRSPERRRALTSLAIGPAMFPAYPLFLWWNVGDPFAFLRAEFDPLWHRELSWAGPLGGMWEGLRAGWAGARQLVAGTDGGTYWPSATGIDPMRAAALNLETLAFLVLFVGLAIVAWRRFGAPYGLFCAVSLAIPLSIPSSRWPLLSIPRFGLVVFPLFLALAWLGGRPRVHGAIVGISSILLGVAVTRWALWQWVA